ncbi:hypothetical protein CN193_22055 [Sinorhizobium meliloti]|uniref:hypothetical protein n=1 Tax=Rhizobium meliloti TaxID=382 RepID=UPI000FDB8942|nr:hypothetical protein [Sinorhizobium meliloti]RVI98961.1 hypothetical protein CN193_22055 [Sinorhizobium meliloti]
MNGHVPQRLGATEHQGLPCALIGTVARGLRLWVLGYSAFAWLDLGNFDYTGDEQIRRLLLMADGDLCTAVVDERKVCRRVMEGSQEHCGGDELSIIEVPAVSLGTVPGKKLRISRF